MTRLAGVPDDIALLQGPLVLGHLFSYLFLGVLMVQIYIYHTNFPNDRASIKVLVWGLFSVECLAAAFSAHAAWHVLGAGWGDPQVLSTPIWSFTALPPLCGFAAMVVQLFYCWRIFALGRNIIIPIFIVAISFTQCGFAFYTGIRMAMTSNLLSGKIIPSYVVMLGASGICDLIITTTMIAFLFRANTSFHSTTSMLNRLITLTVGTGMVTALATWIEVVFLVAKPKTNLHFIICVTLGKLYSNTLLTTLNARALLRSSSQTSQQYKDVKKTILWDDDPEPMMALSTPLSQNVFPQGVHVFTTTETRKDDVESRIVAIHPGA